MSRHTCEHTSHQFITTIQCTCTFTSLLRLAAHFLVLVEVTAVSEGFATDGAAGSFADVVLGEQVVGQAALVAVALVALLTLELCDIMVDVVLATVCHREITITTCRAVVHTIHT